MSTFPQGERERQRPIQRTAAIRLGMAKSKLSKDIWITGVIPFIFGNLVGTPTVARTTRLARMAGMERMSADVLNRQVTLQISLPVGRLFFFFKKKKIRVQTFVNVVHATGREDRTRHRTHHRRTFFSCARHFINAHALAQDELSIRVCSFPKVILSPHVSSQHAWCPWSSSSLSYCTKSGTTCADPRSGSWLGQVAEQSLTTGNDPKDLIEISSEHTPINFPSRKNSFSTDIDDVATVVASDVTETI